MNKENKKKKATTNKNMKKKPTTIKKQETKNKKKNIIREITTAKKKRPKTKIKEKFTLPAILTKINYNEIFFKLFILLVVMILLIFTISRIKKQQEKQNALLNENLTTILNATLNYYQNNSLPINIGDSSSFILEEMKNLNLINDIKDENNKYCNYLDSYIILTKKANEEYHLKIYLKCPTKEKILEEKIICNHENCFTKK